MQYEKEITVMVNMTLEELLSHLEKNNYKIIDDYYVNDIYFTNVEESDYPNPLDLLKKCVLLRSFGENKYYLTYKFKEYDDNENIINQGKINLKVDSYEKAGELLKAIGFKELITIKDHILVYEKDGLELAIEYVNDKYLMLEIEENEKYNSVDKMIEALKSSGISYDESNYYVKKAKMILEETRNKE